LLPTAEDCAYHTPVVKQAQLHGIPESFLNGLQPLGESSLNGSRSFDAGTASLRLEVLENIPQCLLCPDMDSGNLGSKSSAKSQFDLLDGLDGVGEPALVQHPHMGRQRSSH
jgi:hypothetical protein